MTKKQLRALEHLPAVIEALEAVGKDAERLRAAMAKAAGLGALPGRSPQEVAMQGVKPAAAFLEMPPELSPSPVMLPTPERAEYEAERRAAVERARAETPQGKRQQELLAAFRNSPTRQAKLSQFAKDGGDEVPQ